VTTFAEGSCGTTHAVEYRDYVAFAWCFVAALARRPNVAHKLQRNCGAVSEGVARGAALALRAFEHDCRGVGVGER